MLLSGCNWGQTVGEAADLNARRNAVGSELALELQPGPGWVGSKTELSPGEIAVVCYSHTSGANLTLFEYPCSQPCALQADEEMRKSTRAVLKLNRKGWKSVKLLRESTTQLGDSTPNVHSARFRMQADKREHVSKLLVWCKQDFLYKLRVTYPKGKPSRTAVDDMLRIIGNAEFREG